MQLNDVFLIGANQCEHFWILTIVYFTIFLLLYTITIILYTITSTIILFGFRLIALIIWFKTGLREHMVMVMMGYNNELNKKNQA